MERRRDVDGPRTVAVGLVVVEHTGLNIFPGGFIGVDIFFVISGFLISRIIFEELAARDFRLTRFYERRIRRIIPALFTTLFVAVVAKFLLYSQESFENELWVALSAAVSVSNFLFATGWEWLGDTHLLHTWSLGIEEQFYLVFPLVAILAVRYSINLFLTFSIIALASFVWAAVTTAHYEDYMFFMPQLRAWELLMGGLLSAARLPSLQRVNAEIFAFVGLALIVVAAFILSPSKGAFPGPWALLPCLGAVLIIYSGGHETIVKTILSTRPFVGIGVISYSLYLWHYVLFGFFRDYTGKGYNLGLKSSIVMIAISLLVSWASWRWIEQPFRKPGRKRQLATSHTG